MKKLFMICMGGKAPGATIEVHDVQFMIAENIEETFEAIKNNWYGHGLKLHLDSYKAVYGTEGYEIDIMDEPYTGLEDLYFVHIGGYDPKIMGESHKYGLVVAESMEEARKKAIKTLYSGDVQEHLDHIMKVSDCKLLNSSSDGFVHLSKSDKIFDLIPDWYGYKRIDV